MTELNIDLPQTYALENVEPIVDQVCADENRHVTMKSTLNQYLGCIHWHFKQGKARGVLEATWWPRHQEIEPPRLWLSVHGNRIADWIESTNRLVLHHSQAAGTAVAGDTI